MAAEIPDGAVLVARAIINSSLWTMRPADRVLAITCICQANWRPSKWFDGRSEITIRRGEFVTSVDKLVTAGGVTRQTVRTSLKNLENCGFLTRRSTSRYTVIFIPKYDHYQDFTKYYTKPNGSQPTQTPTNDQHTPNKRPPKSQPTPNHKQEGFKREERIKGRGAASATPATAAPPPTGGSPSVSELVQQALALSPSAARRTLSMGAGNLSPEVERALRSRAGEEGMGAP